MSVYPLKFNELFKEKIWGGDALGRYLGKHVPPGGRVGESWELSQHPCGDTVVREGALAGKTLTEVVNRDPKAVLGKWMAKKYGKLPLLFKFIDAQDKLSIQVHPDDAFAELHAHDMGKTEAWYVVHAEPGATLTCGLNREMNKEEVRTSLINTNFEVRLNEFEVRAGDCVFVPAGSVHAIGAGTLLYEVQEASDVTYRMYDWGRKGDDGKPRELHIDESLRVMNYQDTEDHLTVPAKFQGEGFSGEALAGCAYFVMEKYYITGELKRALPDRFEVMTVLSGQGVLIYDGVSTPVKCGETVLVPAAAGEYSVKDVEGGFQCILTWVPKNRVAAKKELLNRGVDKSGFKKLGGLR